MAASGRAVAIVEADARGHHLYYARLVLEAALRAGRKATVWTTAGVAATEEFRVHLSGLGTSHLVAVDVGTAGPDHARMKLVRLALDVGADPMTVIVPHADRMLLPLWWLATKQPFDARLLLMRSPAGPSVSLFQGMRRAAKRIALRRLLVHESIRVAVLGLPQGDPDQQVRIGKRRLPVIPDPPLAPRRLPTVADVRARLQLPSGILFLLIGRLDARKGVPEALDAWRRRQSQSDHLLLVGSVDAGVLPAIRAAMSADSSIILRDGYVSDDDFLAYIKGVDAVITAYHNTGPSGIYAAATTVGTPVIAAGNDAVVSAVRAHGGGLICDLTPESLAAAMDHASNGGVPRSTVRNEEVSVQRTRFTDYFVGT